MGRFRQRYGHHGYAAAAAASCHASLYEFCAWLIALMPTRFLITPGWTLVADGSPAPVPKLRCDTFGGSCKVDPSRCTRFGEGGPAFSNTRQRSKTFFFFSEDARRDSPARLQRPRRQFRQRHNALISPPASVCQYSALPQTHSAPRQALVLCNDTAERDRHQWQRDSGAANMVFRGDGRGLR